jgi:hypothetical protein
VARGGLSAAAAAGETGPTAAPCSTITATLLSPRCMQVAVSMEKSSGTCFAGGGTNELELRRSLLLEAGSYYHRPKTLKPRPVRVSRFWANINEIQNRHEAGNTGMCLVGLSSGFEFLVVRGPCLGGKTPGQDEIRLIWGWIRRYHRGCERLSANPHGRTKN